MKQAHISIGWFVAASAAVAQPLACAGEDPESDTGSAGDEVARMPNSPASEAPLAPTPTAPTPAAPTPAAPTPETTAPETAAPAATAPAATTANEPVPVASMGLDDTGEPTEPTDAGADCDYFDEEPEPYPGCMRG
jgi:hypothetical protein